MKVSDSLAGGKSAVVLAKHIMWDVWGNFLSVDKHAGAWGVRVKNKGRSAKAAKDLAPLLKASIHAKIIALLSLRLIMRQPGRESDDFWPSLTLPDIGADDGEDYADVAYSKYFISRGVAILLDHKIVDFILCQFVGTNVQNELNQNAHFSGLDSSHINDTRSLLFQAPNILDDTLAVKERLPTFHSIYDIISNAPISSGCPIGEASIETAISQLDDENGNDREFYYSDPYNDPNDPLFHNNRYDGGIRSENDEEDEAFGYRSDVDEDADEGNAADYESNMDEDVSQTYA